MFILRKLLLVLIIASLTFSCNSDDPSSEIENPKISKWINKRYNVIDNDLKLIDSATFLLENNKIISASGTGYRNGFEMTYSSNFSYSNGKISQLKTFRDGELNYQEDFSYNNTGKLTQYKNKSWDSEYERFEYYKAELTYSNDTIYKSSYTRLDSNSDYELYRTSKLVLDNNMNRTYEAVYSIDNTLDYIIEIEFDSENNLLNCDLGSEVSRTYTYSNIFNSQSFISFNSFGKETVMLYGALECSPKSPLLLSNNMITSTTVDNSYGYNYEFDFESNDLNYTTKTTYKTFIDGEIREQESSEFIFE